MTELDKIRAEIVERLDRANDSIHKAEFVKETAYAELVAHDRAVAAMGAPPEPAPAATRHSIQRPVMALFEPGTQWNVASIVEKTGLPETAVRKFLGRAVKGGVLWAFDGDAYGLPSTPLLGEAAK